MPKRGFTNTQFRQVFALVNVKTLERCCEKGAEVDVRTLSESGVVRDAKLPLKILGEGELTKKLKVTAAKFSASARAKIEAAGGKAVEIPLKKWRRSAAASNTKTSDTKKTK
jgi:large subunit ribosomal protein L15